MDINHCSNTGTRILGVTISKHMVNTSHQMIVGTAIQSSLQKPDLLKPHEYTRLAMVSTVYHGLAEETNRHPKIKWRLLH